jgi:phage terminase large subunit-like protein
MSDVLEGNAIARCQREPIRFIEEVLRDPRTGRPFQLLEAQRQFFAHCWQRRDDGRLLYPEQVFGAVKKSGKTTTSAMHGLTTTLVFAGKYAEAYCISNDLEQAQGRVFAEIKKICEASPLLRREAHITAERITFPQTGAFIQAIGADYASAAGAHPCFASADELWGFTSERSRRLFDELIPVPTQPISVRLTTTHAGYSGESNLLEDMYKRGLALPEIAPGLHGGDHMLFFWSHEPLASWQTPEWLEEMRRLTRPIQYLRQFENRFVSSENAFIDPESWDRCVNPQLSPLIADPKLPIFVGVDGSVKHDSSAIVAVTFDDKAQLVRLVFHRSFFPTSNDPIDFEACIEDTLLDLRKRACIVKVLFDPYQLQASMQRLAKAGMRVEEFAQTTGNLTMASQQLYELIQSRGLMAYPDDVMRAAIIRCIAIESARGWRIAKERQSHKIDCVIALAQACYAAVHQPHVEDLPVVRPFIFNVRTGEEIVPEATTPAPGLHKPSRSEPWWPYVNGGAGGATPPGGWTTGPAPGSPGSRRGW